MPILVEKLAQKYLRHPVTVAFGENYDHTGRAGLSGLATSFITAEDTEIL